MLQMIFSAKSRNDMSCKLRCQYCGKSFTELRTYPSGCSMILGCGLNFFLLSGCFHGFWNNLLRFYKLSRVRVRIYVQKYFDSLLILHRRLLIPIFSKGKERTVFSKFSAPLLNRWKSNAWSGVNGSPFRRIDSLWEMFCKNPVTVCASKRLVDKHYILTESMQSTLRSVWVL